MKDIRDCDLTRKISLMKGTRIRTFEHRLSDVCEFAMQYTAIKCIILSSENGISETRINRISDILADIISTETIYELYLLARIVLEDGPEKIKYKDMTENDGTGEIFDTSEFMIEINKVFRNSKISQVLLFEAETNEIEGLPEELTEMTLVLAINEFAEGEIISVSDDDIITISD